MSIINKLFLISIFFWGVLSAVASFGQSSDEDALAQMGDAHYYKSLADSLIHINAFDSAMHYAKKSTAIMENLNWKEFMESSNELAFSMYENKKYEYALALATAAKEAGEDSLELEGILKYGYNRLNPGELGMEYDLLAETYQNLAVVNSEKSNYDQAHRFLTQALTLKELIHGEGDKQLMKIYFHFSRIYFFSGSYKKALFANQQGLNIQVRELHETDYQLARTYQNMALIHRTMDNPEKALENYHKALYIYEKNPNNFLGRAERVKPYTNIAKILADKGSYEEAIDYSQKALELLYVYFDPSNKDFAFNFTNIGDCYLEQERFDKALAFYDSARVNKDNYYHDNHPEIADVQLKIGGAYDKMEDYEKALEEYQLIIDALSGTVVQEKNSDTKKTTYSLKNVSSYTHYLEALNAKARSLEYSFQKKQSTSILKNALSTYLMAANVIDTINVLSSPQSYKSMPEGTIEDTYENGIRLAYFLYQDANDPQKKRDYLTNAFNLVEKSRYTKLLNAIKSPTVQYSDGQESKLDSLIEKEKITANNLTLIKRKLLQEEQLDTSRVSIEKRKAMHLQLDVLKSSLQELHSSLESDYPAYYQFRYKHEPLNIQDIHQRLTTQLPETAIIQYYMGNDLGFAFIFSQSGIHLEQFELAPIEDTLVNLLESLHVREMAESNHLRGYNLFRNNSLAIYKHILERPLSFIQSDPVTNLVVIPDGKLTFLPFEALLTKDVEERVQFQNLPYLLNQYVINYAYGMDYFWQDLNTPRNPNPKTYGGWSVPYEYYQIRVAFDEQLTKKFDPKAKETLAKSKQEINQVNSIMNGEVYTGTKASENEFIKKVNEYSINHLALNCFVFADKPIDSKLLFFNAANNDDFLNMYEVYSNPIETELLVLGATMPVEEDREKVDGYLNVSRAFAYAGCPSLVTSLWRAEEFAPEMMKTFFEELQDGKAINISLHQAKKRMLLQNNSQKAHPYYWAGLINVGNPTAVVKRGIGISTLLSFVAGVLVLLIIGGIVYWYLVERKEEME